MRIKDIVSISGMGGLYKTETQKVNGLIVTSLGEGWTKFISNRQHLFSPLDSISIYTDDENIDLADVLIEVHNQKEKHPAPDAKEDDKTIRAWFTQIVPRHDKEKVYVSDIRKLIKWFDILEQKGIIADELKARDEEKERETEAEKGNTIEKKTEKDEEIKKDEL